VVGLGVRAPERSEGGEGQLRACGTGEGDRGLAGHEPPKGARGEVQLFAIKKPQREKARATGMTWVGFNAKGIAS